MVDIVPDFVCIGAPKCGTTWLHSCLEEDRDVSVPVTTKETNYFSSNYGKGQAWFNAQYSREGRNTIVGEVSPSYFSCERAPKRIAQDCGDVVLIVLLRDPIDRAYSHYCMHVRSGDVTKRPEVAIDPESVYIENSRYGTHLSTFLEWFEREQLGVYLLEEIAQDPGRVYQSICRHIGASTESVPECVAERYHTAGGVPKSYTVHRAIVRLSELIHGVGPAGRRLVEWCRSGWVSDWYNSISGGTESYPELKYSHKRKMADWLEPEMSLVKGIVGGHRIDCWETVE